ETGHGTYHSGALTISRDTVLENSNGDTNPVNFSASPTVWLDYLSQDIIGNWDGTSALQLGAADAAAPAAQTLQVPNVAAGNSNVAGADWKINGSKGTGTGIGGSLLFQVAPAGASGTAQNPVTEYVRVDQTGQLVLNNGSGGAPSTITPNPGLI